MGIIPPKLAYGDEGYPRQCRAEKCQIPPSRPLEITLELVSAGDGFLTGPQGIEYRDFTVGKGDEVATGDLIETNFILGLAGGTQRNVLFEPPRFANSQIYAPTKTVDVQRAYTFTIGKNVFFQGWDLAVLGGETMPPMRVGGTRKVIIPSQLAYGKTGKACRGGKVLRKCDILPDTDLELVIDVVSIDVKASKKAAKT